MGLRVAEALLRQTRFAVRLDGTQVVLEIGNGAVAMDYDTANRVAVLLRGMARKAKHLAGDRSLKVLGFADLTDATLDELQAQRNKDATAVFTRGR